MELFKKRMDKIEKKYKKTIGVKRFRTLGADSPSPEANDNDNNITISGIIAPRSPESEANEDETKEILLNRFCLDIETQKQYKFNEKEIEFGENIIKFSKNPAEIVLNLISLVVGMNHFETLLLKDFNEKDIIDEKERVFQEVYKHFYFMKSSL